MGGSGQQDTPAVTGEEDVTKPSLEDKASEAWAAYRKVEKSASGKGAGGGIGWN